jgi:hypothetical protein
MLDLLDQLDLEYTRISNLGRWIKKEDSQVLALTATIASLQSKLSSLQGQYSSLHALFAQSILTPTPKTQDKLQKPPPRKPSDPEITTFNGLVWKWCDKCFNGSWNHTHITSEHVAGVGKRNRRRQDGNNNNNSNGNNQETPPATNNAPIPQANLVQLPTSNDSTPTPTDNQANITALSSPSLDFL